MYLHPDLLVCYLAHARVGSQATRDELEARGFVLIGNHHHGPDDLDDDTALANLDLWASVAQDEVRYFSTVRNPFDAVYSWWTKVNRTGAYTDGISRKYLDMLLGQNRFHFPTFRKRQGPDCEFWRFTGWSALAVLRFERLHEDLDALLQSLGLGSLEDFPVNERYVSPDKPPHPYHRHWRVEAKRWFEFNYAAELDRLGYSFWDPA